MKDDLFLSVDWGTSNFRLRLAEKSLLHIVEELVSPMGVKSLYLKWQQEGGDREFIFLEYLKQQINELPLDVPQDIEIIISGMASSGMGLRELPYATLPFYTNGKGLYIEHIKHSLFPYGFRLVSGVRSDADVMRGEEIQMIGLAGEVNQNEKNCFIFPGTHSKHIMCEDGRVTGFNTFMTGELFEIICYHTLLKNSIEKPLSESVDMTAFTEGVVMSQSGSSILNNLFKVRTRDVLDHRSTEENYYFLSGLLIGEEMNTLHSASFERIILCAGNELHELYECAIRVSGLAGKTKILDKENIEKAVVKGQLKIAGLKNL